MRSYQYSECMRIHMPHSKQYGRGERRTLAEERNKARMTSHDREQNIQCEQKEAELQRF
jgi:hypothetical protein